MKCFFCLGHCLRPSRIRWFDLPLLALLLRPYRCSDCGRRSIGFVWNALFKPQEGPVWFPEAWDEPEPPATVKPAATIDEPATIDERAMAPTSAEPTPEPDPIAPIRKQAG